MLELLKSLVFAVIMVPVVMAVVLVMITVLVKYQHLFWCVGKRQARTNN
ncbi:AcrZ family multidrug efflux pump-associated protein [Shigella flexneri]